VRRVTGISPDTVIEQKAFAMAKKHRMRSSKAPIMQIRITPSIRLEQDVP
jgi:hypothetical protein